MRDECGEIGHRSDTQEDERRVPALAHTLVEDVQHRTVFINADVKSREHRDVSYYHTETYRHEQERLPFLDYGNGDEGDADCYHHKILDSTVGEACVLPELLETANDLVHLPMLLIRRRHLRELNLPWKRGLRRWYRPWWRKSRSPSSSPRSRLPSGLPSRRHLPLRKPR